MASVDSEVTTRLTAKHFEPLAVSPRQACLLLGVGITRLYQLIGNGELESYLDGRSRRITMESIRRRVTQLLAGAGVPSAATKTIPQPRKRGRPRKAESDVARRLDELTGASLNKLQP